MNHVGKYTRLTDSLERELMARAIEEQFRFRPVLALKSALDKLAGLLGSIKAEERRETVSAS
ncbi:MAG TPA: hypothetical protein VNQ97_05835 [Burkholderiaceae bacterium]|nr:hypothetical protein [Burkholderiaceae bacterium]